MTRRICYVSGTRADFGLMRSSLLAVQSRPGLELDVLVTGMHLSAEYGHTAREIHESGLLVRAEVPVPLEPATGATMARNLGRMIMAFVDEWTSDRPDIVLLLGDRGEMLAGAIAAIHLNLPIVHVHGGERSGTVDEPVRHAISKLAHFHFVATQDSRERLIRMGERPEAVWVTGAPGLDGLVQLATLSRVALCEELGLDPERPVALMVFHPVLQEAEQAAGATRLILDSLCKQGMQVVAVMPNSDAGSAPIREELQARHGQHGVRVLTHLARSQFASWMAQCDVMVGNSSAGIIEAASFGTPVLNLGSRQYLRERNTNTVDAPLEHAALLDAFQLLLRRGRQPSLNVYGDGHTAERIADLLGSLTPTPDLLSKTNAY
ncbi:MAG: UDP-N-acetylglucosamine 2-epimerase (hydrolyzing) [Rhodocyclales bacterium]|nr:UDP-N-acetylglucosamine 2-epimerase (hydrolyzing) [Rhodocyclales bacterium]